MKTLSRIGASMLGLVLFCIPALFAQTSSTGELTGVVSDTTGAILPGAHVSIANSATGEIKTSDTNQEGLYRFPLLSPGTYSLKVEREGFKTANKSAIKINITEVQSLAVTLSPGAVSETVEVTTSPSLVQTDNAAMGSVIEQQQITSLPLAARNYLQILGFAAGVTMPVTNAADLGRGNASEEGGGDPDTAGVKTTHGSRPYDNDFQVNGIEVNDDLGYNLAQSGGMPIPNPDTLMEFKVQTSQYDASYGRNAGSQINLLTRSGTSSSMAISGSTSGTKI